MKMKKNLLLAVAGVTLLLIGACHNPFFPPKEDKETPPIKEAPVDPVPIDPAPEEEAFTIVIDISGDESGDTVTVSPNTGNEGDTVTLAYTVADTAHYNLLDFGGVTASIASVDSAGNGTRTYTINAADSANGVITITAVFTHTNLIPDHIAFTDTAGHITTTYGDAAFTNAIAAGYKGSGAITYSSSDTTVAVVDGAGQVAILKAGSAIITAEKAADAIYAHAQTNYTLTVNRKPVTITGLSADNKQYDGTTTATVSGTAVISGLVGGDTVTIVEGTAAFEDKNAGTGKTVTFSGWSLSGAGAESYILQMPSLTADIFKAPGAAVSQPSVNGSPTYDSITINAVSLQTATGQGIEYAVSTASNETGLSAWQTSVTFTGLNAATTYYVYARSAENTNYTAGTANVSGGISTAVAVIFNSNGGSSVSTQTITAGAVASRPTNPTRSSYIFDYWYQNAELTTPYYFDTPVTANITLYARWVSTAIIQEIASNMVSIPAGTFIMGSPTSEPNRSSYETQHSVTLTKNFYMSKYQVTQAQYQAVMGTNPSYFTTANGRVPADGESDERRPVENVTWYDTVEFCNKLSVLEGLQEVYTISGRTPASGYPITAATVTADFTKNGYRLPTEAEWEYACRAGTTTVYNTGDTISDDTGWYSGNSGSKTHEVGLKPANAWELYDMHGNVQEWCWDWYSSYTSGAQENPVGASSGTNRAGRGGSWEASVASLRSAYRYSNYPYVWYGYIGFRLVRQ